MGLEQVVGHKHLAKDGLNAEQANTGVVLGKNTRWGTGCYIMSKTSNNQLCI